MQKDKRDSMPSQRTSGLLRPRTRRAVLPGALGPDMTFMGSAVCGAGLLLPGAPAPIRETRSP